MSGRTNSSQLKKFLRRPAPVWWRCSRAAALGVLIVLAGCASGDFGRVRPSLVKDDMHSWVGTEAPNRQGRPPSKFPLTDAERQLRDLAYPLIEPPYDRGRWYSVLAEYGINGRSEMPYPDRSAYATQLLATPVRSQYARYAKLTEDIRNDVVRVDPFFAVARYVIDMDKKRIQSLSRFAAANKEAEGDARARIAENVAVIEWVQNSMHARVASYQLALERLVVEAPSPTAAEAERSLTLLQSRIAVHRSVLHPEVADVSASDAANLPPAK
jgi:hypothetical protein